MEYLKKFRAYAPEFETGCLCGKSEGRPINAELEKKLLELGITEICPDISEMTEEQVARWHSMGFRVRAWGIRDEELMRKTVDWGTDGTTCNFPDKLAAYLAEKK